MYAVILVAITFCSGIFILNALVFIFLAAVFFTHKLLILKHHQKSQVFNEDIPLMSLLFLKLAILLHIIVAFIWFTEGDKLIIHNFEFIKEMRLSILSFWYKESMVSHSQYGFGQKLSSNIGFIYALFIQLLVLAFLLKIVY